MSIPILLVPGLNCTPRVFAEQIPALWPHGPVTVANHLEGASLREIAANILAAAPPTFALVGFSLGGYLAFEMLRQARERILRLALVDTSARPDSAEQTANRRAAIALTEAGKFSLMARQNFPNTVHPSHVDDPVLRAIHLEMAEANGPEIYIRQQHAIIARPDSRPELAAIRVPTLVAVGDSDAITTPEVAREMADGIAGARLVIIPTAGHMTFLEQPAAVRDALVSWISTPKP